MTGVTVVLCPQGAVAAAELRGSATGTRRTRRWNAIRSGPLTGRLNFGS